MADVPVLVPNAEGAWVWEWRVPTTTPTREPRVLCAESVPDKGPMSYQLVHLLASQFSAAARPTRFTVTHALAPRSSVAPCDRAIRAVVKAWRSGGWAVDAVPYMRGSQTVVSFAFSHPHTVASVPPSPPPFRPLPARRLT